MFPQRETHPKYGLSFSCPFAFGGRKPIPLGRQIRHFEQLMTGVPNLAFWYGVMKKTHFLNSGFFLSCQKMAKACLAFIQLNEADACTLLSAYGLCAFEVDRLQNDR